MPYMIAENCQSCATCELECPNDAISLGEEIYVIDPDRCTECVGFYETSKCVEVCPVDAPAPDPDHQESREQLLEKWRHLHPDEEPKTT